MMVENIELLKVNQGGIFDTAGMIQSAIDDINALILQGLVNWNRASSAIGKLDAVLKEIKKQQEVREKAFREAQMDALKDEVAEQAAAFGR